MAILTAPPLGDKVESSHLKDIPREGIHQHLAALAGFCKSREVSKERAIELIAAKAEEADLRRPLQANEVEDAVESIYEGEVRTKQPSPRKENEPPQAQPDFSGEWPASMPLPSVKPDPVAIRKVLRAVEPWSLKEASEDSPIKGPEKLSPEQILSMIFGPSDLLVSGVVDRFAVKPCEQWVVEGGVSEQVVPNPNRIAFGKTKKGSTSAHCRDAVGPRHFLVIEFDDEELGHDRQATLIRFLRDVAGGRLRMLVDSGGKSLHGWFQASPCEAVNWSFMRLACRLGADPRMWLPEQFARTPNATRSNGAFQKTYYLDAL
jgi:hypothetical protein